MRTRPASTSARARSSGTARARERNRSRRSPPAFLGTRRTSVEGDGLGGGRTAAGYRRAAAPASAGGDTPRGCAAADRSLPRGRRPRSARRGSSRLARRSLLDTFPTREWTPPEDPAPRSHRRRSPPPGQERARHGRSGRGVAPLPAPPPGRPTTRCDPLRRTCSTFSKAPTNFCSSQAIANGCRVR